MEEQPKQNYLAFLWRHLTTGQKFSIGALLLLLVAFPIAVIVALMPTNPFSRAGGTPTTPTAGATTILYTDPQSTQDQAHIVNTNQEFTVDIMMDTQLNTVSAAKVELYITNNILEVLDVQLSDYLPTLLENVVIDKTTDPSNTRVSFTVGSTADQPRQGIGKLATLTLKSNENDVMGSVGFVNSTEVAAIGEEGNVLNFFQNLSILVLKTPVTPTPTETPVLTPTPTDVPTPTPTEAPNTAQLDIKFNLNTVTGKANDLTLVTTLEPVNCASCSALTVDNISASNDDSGVYTATVPNITLGSNNTYNVFVKPEGFLRKLVGMITLIPGANLITGDPAQGGLNLVAGDLNGNGEVDIYDFTTVIEDFGLTNSPADFNRNGEVDIYDFTSVVEFFGTTGD